MDIHQKLIRQTYQGFIDEINSLEKHKIDIPAYDKGLLNAIRYTCLQALKYQQIKAEQLSFTETQKKFSGVA